MNESTIPTCREALQQIVKIVDADGSFVNDLSPDIEALAAARAALAAPDPYHTPPCTLPSGQILTITAHNLKTGVSGMPTAVCLHLSGDMGQGESTWFTCRPLIGDVHLDSACADRMDEARRTLPPDVREALQCAADYGPMGYGEWREKWADPADHRDEFMILAGTAGAVLAKYPETAPVTERTLTSHDQLETALVERMDQHEADKAAWIRERDELIAERDRFEAEAERRSLDGVQIGQLRAEAALWQDRAEWLLSQLRGGDS